MGRPAPKFWWDFVDNAKAVIVQSDHGGGEELARFEAHAEGESMELQIRQAEELIGDYAAGRKQPQWTRQGNTKTGQTDERGK